MIPVIAGSVAAVAAAGSIGTAAGARFATSCWVRMPAALGLEGGGQLGLVTGRGGRIISGLLMPLRAKLPDARKLYRLRAGRENCAL